MKTIIVTGLPGTGKTSVLIPAMTKKETIFVDTHCTIKTPAGTAGMGFARAEAECNRPNRNNPEEIAKRRASDESRTRDRESEDEIAVHQEINRAAAISYCMLTGATAKIIKNRQNRLLDAVKEFVGLV